MDKIINIAIVEDSQEDLNNCLALLNTYSKEKGIEFNINTFSNGDSFLMRFKGQYDFIILDINLSEMNGIDVAKTIRKTDEDVIVMFVTNLAKYATKGYEVDAVDFVLKPLTYASFYLKLEKAIKRIVKKEKGESIVLSSSGGYIKAEINDIAYIEVIAHDIIFHLTNGEKIFTSGTLKKYAEDLKKHWFLRCNSCYLVNARKIKKIDKLEIKLVNNETILISHPKRKEFMENFKKYIMEDR